MPDQLNQPQFVQFQARHNQPTTAVSSRLARFLKGLHFSNAAPPSEPNRAQPAQDGPGGLRPESPKADGQVMAVSILRSGELRGHLKNLSIAEVQTKN